MKIMADEKRGLIFSTDAVLAVVISVLFSYFSFSVMMNLERNAVDDLQLARVSADCLRAMEKAGLFQNATVKDAEDAKQEITNFTAGLPYNLCIYEIEFKKHPFGNVTARISRIRGCQCTTRIATTKRTYVAYNATTATLEKYVVRQDSCYSER